MDMASTAGRRGGGGVLELHHMTKKTWVIFPTDYDNGEGGGGGGCVVGIARNLLD